MNIPTTPTGGSPALLAGFSIKVVKVCINLHADVHADVRKFLCLPAVRGAAEDERIYRFDVAVFSNASDEQLWNDLSWGERVAHAYCHECAKPQHFDVPLIAAPQASAVDSAHFFAKLFSIVGYPFGWDLRDANLERGPCSLSDLLGDVRQSLSSFMSAYCIGNGVELDLYLPPLDLEVRGFPALAAHLLSDSLRGLGKFRTNDADPLAQTCVLDQLAGLFERAHIIPRTTSLDSFRMVIYEVFRCFSSLGQEAHGTTPGEEALFLRLRQASSRAIAQWNQNRRELRSTAKNNLVLLDPLLHRHYDAASFYIDVFGEKTVWIGRRPMPLALILAALAPRGSLPLSDFLRDASYANLPTLFGRAGSTMYEAFATDFLKAAIAKRAAIVNGQRRHTSGNSDDDPDSRHSTGLRARTGGSGRHDGDGKDLGDHDTDHTDDQDAGQSTPEQPTDSQDDTDASRRHSVSGPFDKKHDIDGHVPVTKTAHDDFGGSRQRHRGSRSSAGSSSSGTAHTTTSDAPSDIKHTTLTPSGPQLGDDSSGSATPLPGRGCDDARPKAHQKVQEPQPRREGIEDFRSWWCQTGGTGPEDRDCFTAQERRSALQIADLSRFLGTAPASKYAELRRMAASPLRPERERIEKLCKKRNFDLEHLRRILGVSTKRCDPDEERDVVNLSAFEELTCSYDRAVFYTAWPSLIGKASLP